MKKAEWMWLVLDRMEFVARSNGWTDMIDQINVTRSVLTQETSSMRGMLDDKVIRVDFKQRRQRHFLEASTS